MKSDILEALRAAAAAQRATAAALEAIAAAAEQAPDVEPAITVASAGELLDVRHAAERLGMSVSWVYRQVESGRLSCVRIGNRVRFRVADLEVFVAERSAGGDAC
ncbi:MAG: helix-turn-helix domain-containing protein [Myxococcales bacterium]|nr:helix-turn-helix domain-containing protein [Myxococcales bacterium]